MTLTNIAVAIAIAVGLVGIIVPILPGTLLIMGAIVAWALEVGGTTAWLVCGVAAVWLLLGTVIKYVVPGKRLKDAGIPASTQWAGALLGVIGFFVVPVLGLFIGFVLGVYLAEYRRVGQALAWPSTKHALKAVGLSILIELIAGVLATVTWVVGVILI